MLSGYDPARRYDPGYDPTRRYDPARSLRRKQELKEDGSLGVVLIDIYQALGLEGDRLKSQAQKVKHHLEQSLFITSVVQLHNSLQNEDELADIRLAIRGRAYTKLCEFISEVCAATVAGSGVRWSFRTHR